jgi:hypothetical protein
MVIGSNPPAAPTPHCIVGQDIGERIDYSAIAVLECADEVTGLPDPATHDLLPHTTLALSHVERIRLGTPSLPWSIALPSSSATRIPPGVPSSQTPPALGAPSWNCFGLTWPWPRLRLDAETCRTESSARTLHRRPCVLSGLAATNAQSEDIYIFLHPMDNDTVLGNVCKGVCVMLKPPRAVVR